MGGTPSWPAGAAHHAVDPRGAAQGGAGPGGPGDQGGRHHPLPGPRHPGSREGHTATVRGGLPSGPSSILLLNHDC